MKQELIGFRVIYSPCCNEPIPILAVKNADYYPKCPKCGMTYQVNIE